MSYHKRTTCRLCDSTQLALALHYPPQPLADEYLKSPQWQPDYPLDLYLCQECGCAQLLDVVSGDEIYPAYTYETGSSPALVEHFAQYASDLLRKLKPKERDLIIDIGCNDGTLLKFFPSYMRRLGIDPAVKFASVREAGLSIWTKYFDADSVKWLQFGYGPAKIITANNIFANIDNLREFAENVRNILAPDGVFVFETFYLADFIDNMVFDFIYHEHLTAFSVAPLIGFFQRLGMQIFDVQRIPTKGGSIRVYVQLEGGDRKVTPDVPALVEWEYLRGLHKIETFKKFSSEIMNRIARINAFAWSNPGTWTGYGASPTSTTLLYSLGFRLDYLIDDWPGKWDTFSPGYHLPVFAPDVLLAEGGHVSPDYCLILAWRYAEAIMVRNPQYRGTWIVPLPELRVIKAPAEVGAPAG